MLNGCRGSGSQQLLAAFLQSHPVPVKYPRVWKEKIIFLAPKTTFGSKAELLGLKI